MHKVYIFQTNTFLRNILVILFMGASFSSYAQIISTFAGNGVAGHSGNSGPATAAELYTPSATAIDRSGNVYIGDDNNSRIRKVNTSGIITSIAGNGIEGYSGDGGFATAAEITFPDGVAVDSTGNIYIADNNNERIRIVNTSGIINTFAGNSTASYSGDGGQVTAAELSSPTGVIVDSSGNVYIADLGSQRIRKVNSSGIITTIAGNGMPGYSGNGGSATAAELQYPAGITVDAAGNLYIGDEFNNCIRKVNTLGIISTVAGNGYDEGTGLGGFTGDGGQATDAELDQPYGVAMDVTGNIYIADEYNDRVRVVNTSGIINTFAGTNGAGYSGDGGPATAADLNFPMGVTADISGNVYIADYNNNRIRKVTGSISTGINSSLSNNYAQVTIYPVPNTGIFTVTGVIQGQIIELYTNAGQKIETQCISSVQSDAHFDISTYSNGIYLIRILSKGGSVVTSKKIAKIE